MTPVDPEQPVANRMKYSANKLLLLLAIVMGGVMSIVGVWAGLPAETVLELLKLLVNALGIGVVVSGMTFAMSWVFYKLIGAVGTYIHDRFYRTPTL
jgi:hypothetical protein